MKTMMKMKILAAFVVMGIAGMASNSYAQPVAYAVSYSNTTGGFVDITNEPSGTAAPLSDINSITDTSVAQASLNLVGSQVTTGGVPNAPIGTPTPLAQYIAPGSTVTPNTSSGVPFLPVGNTYTGNNNEYSYAAAQIPTVFNPVGPTYISAGAIAEAQVIQGDQAASSAQNKSTSSVSMNFVVPTDTTVTVTVGADITSFLNAILSVNGLGNEASASQNYEIKLFDNATGQTIFDFNPNGTANDVTQSASTVGTVINTTVDPGSLNQSTTAEFFSNNPAGYPLTSSGFYEITSTGIGAGNYTLTLNDVNSEQVITAPTPEPGTILLMGAGLLGLGAFYRRKKA